jgi:hypothetical protein
MLTYQLSVTPQPRSRFELIAAHPTSFVVFGRPRELVERKGIKVVKIEITLVTVVVLLRVLLVVLHRCLRVKRLVAVCIRALDPPKWLEFRRHVGL